MLVLCAALLVNLPMVSDTGDYWQQRVRYEIAARLDEPSGVLAGRQRIVYGNASPDTLRHFYLHLYLNAFRPGSRWSDRDSIEGRRRFNDLTDPHFGFNRVRNVRIAGRVVDAEYPYAPDSTIARFRLPAALVPGDSLVVEMDWEARPSTVPRRQGRRGRRFDFAQWYPRVVAYDRYGWQDNPLQPAGEFYGEFATFDVVLDVAADQVIGATGVPVEGDPGWEGARADGSIAVDYQRDWYDGGPAARCGAMADGRKCVRFRAEDVHHFALSLNPDYVYEQGRYQDVVVRVLYLPGDAATWGGGIAVRRTVEALRWLDELFGPYPWPQLTNLHRIERGGTEFPMMVMDGSASQSLILHEVGHNYLMGILANNEWKEGFLDEGFTSFQTAWYFEEHVEGFDGYASDEAAILELDLGGWSEPVSTPGHEFRDFRTYNAMTYTKGELFFHQLRYIVGHDVMRQILRTYYARWRLKHVAERDFLAVAEDVSGMELTAFFGQWLHGTPRYDFAIGRVRRRQVPGGWETTVTVERRGDGWMPVEVGERRSDSAIVHARSSARGGRDTIVFVTPDRPGRLMLDPRLMTHDWNYLNNRERSLFYPGERWRIDTWVHEPTERDRMVRSISPSVWYNDAGGLTLGLRVRSNYLGLLERRTAWVQRGITGDDPAVVGDLYDFYFRIENPVAWYRPQRFLSAETWMREGTAGVRVMDERARPRAWHRADVFRSGWIGQWVSTPATAFLDSELWEDGGTVELSRYWEWDLPDGATRSRLRVEYGTGLSYALRGAGLRLNERYDVEPFGRVTGAASARHRSGRFDLGVRLAGGLHMSQSQPLRQRAIAVSGADPYQTLRNPFVRARGALFVKDGVYYHSPGSINLRGYAPRLRGRWAAAINLEVETVVLERRSGLVRRASLVEFGDAGLVDGSATGSLDATEVLVDAGIGLRFLLQLGEVTIPLRLEAPLYISQPALGQDRAGGDHVAFRWLFSLEPSF